jgi:alkylation response protein AidB-like acyl-CoA dehydrogenase
MIADSWIEMESFRLLVLRTAWRIDKYKDYKRVRKDISAVKVAMPKVFHDVAARALHLHGSLGVSDEMPFRSSSDGDRVVPHGFPTRHRRRWPTEVHKVTVARQVLSHRQWPTKTALAHRLLGARLFRWTREEARHVHVWSPHLAALPRVSRKERFSQYATCPPPLPSSSTSVTGIAADRRCRSISPISSS